MSDRGPLHAPGVDDAAAGAPSPAGQHAGGERAPEKERRQGQQQQQQQQQQEQQQQQQYEQQHEQQRDQQYEQQHEQQHNHHRLHPQHTHHHHQQRPPVEMRVHFEEFAAQLRAHRDREHKRRMLQHRRQGLRRGVALAARLQRLTSWLHDGLVEIGNHHDAAAFVHVHQNLQELTDTCFAHWNRDIQAMDPINHGHPRRGTTDATPAPEPEPVLAKLTADARRECVDFIHAVRSSPRFLIDRFAAVSPSQLAALSTSPRFQDLSASVLTSLSQNRGRGSQRKRVQSYSKVLDEYAASFERKNPMSFLLYNCFGPSSRAEETLRLRTWSAICAGLYVEAYPAFGSIIKQVLSNFCTMQPWRARDRMELFLMDVLQRGAFLLEPVGEYRSKAVLQTHISDTLDTDGAREFFDDAARQLFAILRAEDGGYPAGAIEFCRALLAQLPEDAHASVRSFLAFDWFLDEFLRITITYPENEKMLLQFHISEPARVHILHQLWFRAQARVRDVWLPEKQRPVDPDIEASFNDIISKIDPIDPPPDPYALPPSATTTTNPDNSLPHPEQPSLVLCASDVLHVLEALGQQYLAPSSALDPFLTSSFSAFNSQYARTNRFGRLKRELMVHLESAYTTTAVHPCQEQWMVLPLRPDGHLNVDEILKPPAQPIDATLWSHCGDLTLVQEAALRLAFDEADISGSPPSPDSVVKKSLADRLAERSSIARSSSNNLVSFYWQRAFDALQQAHSPATWIVNDSRIFKSILSRFPPPVSPSALDHLDQAVTVLEHHFVLLKERIAKASLQLGRLKIKMWYIMGVTNSEAYERARNISRALNYMAFSGQTGLDTASRASSDRDRPATSASTTSSIFEQSRIDTMNILKAPKEHGGPRKLADDQIDLTKRWLDRHNIENFCKGEERIHRFCMEIKMLAKNLVGESLLESPVLWSSDLWAKERALFDISGPNLFHPASSTRPPSVMSETLSSAQFSARPSIRTLDSGSRSLDADLSTSPGRKSSFPAFGATRFNRDLLGSDLASTFSPGHTLTATSGESVSTIFSPLPSLSRSATSVSSRSQTPSLYNEAVILKVPDPASGKAIFLDRLQHELTCLLLSDLGNPVWSRGSETDSWLDGARQNPAIVQRLSRRKLVATVLPLPKLPAEVPPQPAKPKRTPATLKRWSSDDARMYAQQKGQEQISTDPPPEPSAVFTEERELQDVLERLSRQVDPAMKLQAVHDFKQLALAFSRNHTRNPPTNPSESNQGPTKTFPRRQSLGAQVSTLQSQNPPPKPASKASPTTENEIVKELKTVLLRLRPATLFRDLQYIAAFISVDALSDSEARRAFWHVGLAALASKDEICRCMVDLADQIVSKDLTATQRPDPVLDLTGDSPLIKAKDYWILAAREGNPVAQRELAGLYLTHPDIPPIISLPLTLSSEIFKQDMKWQNEPEHDQAHTQALCLALHWMNAAAANGDEIAKRRIQERKDIADLVLG